MSCSNVRGYHPEDLNSESHLVLGRREFTLQAALAMLSGVVITITGCGSMEVSPTSPSPSLSLSPSPSPSPSPGPSGDVVGSISANHGHSAVITRAALTAGNAVSLDIHGSA